MRLDFYISMDDRINFNTFPPFSMSNFPEEGKSTISYFAFRADVWDPIGRRVINQVFHKLMIISFQTRMRANAISQEQIVLRVSLICLTIGLGKEPGKRKSLCGVLRKLCVLP